MNSPARRQVPLKSLLLVACTLVTLTNLVRADLVFSTGPPSLSGGGVDLRIFVGAESFRLSTPTTIKAVQFFTGEYAPWWDGTLEYFFFNNDGALPSSSPLPGSHGSNPPFTKRSVPGGPFADYTYEYQFDLLTPLALNPGTYWLGLRLDDFTGNSDISWVATITPNAQVSAAAPFGDFTQWWLQSSQLAFALSDTPLVIPEPAGNTLFALALALIALRHKAARATPVH
jgi:hypothetical protein